MSPRALRSSYPSRPASLVCGTVDSNSPSRILVSPIAPYFPFPFRRTVALAWVASRSKAKADTLTWT
jgi:hypothetical protein